MLQDVFDDEQVRFRQIDRARIADDELDLILGKALGVVEHDRRNVDAQIINVTPVDELRRLPVTATYVDDAADAMLCHKIF